MTDFQNNQQPQTQLSQEEEIDIIALAKTVWDKRKIIIKITVVFMIIGLFVAIFTPKQYSSTAILVPQTSQSNSKMGGLSSLAAMAGFNLDMGKSGTELNPMVYPQIVQSIPFRKELIQTKLNFKGIDHQISFYDYYTNPDYAKSNVLGFVKKFTIGLPGTIIKAIRGKKEETDYVITDQKQLIKLSTDEQDLIDAIGKMVYLNVEDRKGYLTLTSIMPEPLATAQMGQKALELLQKYITKFKIEKAQERLKFITERYNEKKMEFKQAQLNLALFRDKNKNIITEIDKTEIERLQSEYQLIFNVYSDLAKQLEAARIQVKEDTPVLTIIEPITIPTESFKPKRKQILLIWTFIGLIIGIGWVFGFEYFKKIKKKWNENKEAEEDVE
ncbi:MAG: lipopolysaccharide biosynthesis protein [Bacteroidales bacterium]|nr:lipopolysaccharide biosynthesis protein [Bacteroidales bacterium]